MEPAKKKTFRRISETYLHNAGLHYLQRFATGEGNFRRVMKRKIDNSCRAHPDQDRADCLRMLDELVTKFRRSGLLDDGNYAGAAVRTMRRRGLSARAINAKLTAKGVAVEIVATAIAACDAELKSQNGDMVAAARHAMRRRLGPFARATTEERTSKELSSFARAGFSYEIAQRILKMDMGDIETLATGDSA
ncbi:MAG TPA: RecX family transcriptional regulator [Alphaproteobacteria bacterium]